MIRRSHGLGLVACAAALGLTFAGAEFSGASAQDTETGSNSARDTADASNSDAATVFVSQEVVQPLAAPDGQESTSNVEAATGKPGSLYELVAATDTDFALSEQMRCLAGAVYFESRGEPLAGQLAVAQVVINRAESNLFPASYCGVVTQRAQFSFVRGGVIPQARTGTEAWMRAKAIARIAHEGLWDSEAGDSLYFHAKYVRPSWSRKKTALATINQHIFYR